VKTEDGGSERQLILFHDLTQHVWVHPMLCLFSSFH
jgi:hypothetical protein